MRRAYVLLMSIILLFGCGQEKSALKKGTPEYDFAKKVSEKVAFFDPDVNNTLIYTRHFNIHTGEVMQTIFSNMGRNINRFYNLDTTSLKQILKSNGQNFADYKLLLHAARTSKIQISPVVMDSLMNQQYLRYGGRDNFFNSLKAQGIDSNAVMKQMQEAQLIDRYLDKTLSERLAVSEDTLLAIYNQDKTASVRHILLSTQGKSDAEKAEVYQKAEGILARAKRGEDFAKLAREFTEDPGSRDRGGLYENFGRGDMVKPFEDAAFSVPVGQVSDIVETAYGYHILKVESRTRESRPFEEVREEILQEQQQVKKPELYQKYLEQLREESQYRMAEF